MQLARLFVMALCVTVLCSCSCFKNDSAGDGAQGNIPTGTEVSPLKDVNFDFDKSVIRADAKPIMAENAQWLKDNAEKSAVVEGHCDERGTNEYNMALGERRAKAAYDYLRSLGIAESRMSTISYGEELPLDPAKNEAAYAKNRRAHFAVK